MHSAMQQDACLTPPIKLRSYQLLPHNKHTHETPSFPNTLCTPFLAVHNLHTPTLTSGFQTLQAPAPIQAPQLTLRSGTHCPISWNMTITTASLGVLHGVTVEARAPQLVERCARPSVSLAYIPRCCEKGRGVAVTSGKSRGKPWKLFGGRLIDWRPAWRRVLFLVSVFFFIASVDCSAFPAALVHCARFSIARHGRKDGVLGRGCWLSWSDLGSRSPLATPLLLIAKCLPLGRRCSCRRLRSFVLQSQT